MSGVFICQPAGSCWLQTHTRGWQAFPPFLSLFRRCLHFVLRRVPFLRFARVWKRLLFIFASHFWKQQPFIIHGFIYDFIPIFYLFFFAFVFSHRATDALWLCCGFFEEHELHRKINFEKEPGQGKNKKFTRDCFVLSIKKLAAWQ